MKAVRVAQVDKKAIQAMIAKIDVDGSGVLVRLQAALREKAGP
jgi:hypothetical protein